MAGGTDTCINPGTGAGQCGAGIPMGTPLTFNLQFATGITTQTAAVNDEIASWNSAGIHINETSTDLRHGDRQRHGLHPGPELYLGDAGLGRQLGLRPRLLPDR